MNISNSPITNNQHNSQTMSTESVALVQIRVQAGCPHSCLLLCLLSNLLSSVSCPLSCLQSLSLASYPAASLLSLVCCPLSVISCPLPLVSCLLSPLLSLLSPLSRVSASCLLSSISCLSFLSLVSRTGSSHSPALSRRMFPEK